MVYYACKQDNETEKSGATRSFLLIGGLDLENKKRPVAEVCWELGAPIAEQLGLDIWDVRFVKEGADWILRYFVDKDGGVGIDDCVAFSRAINPVLDEADPIGPSYCLEVSSPGVERELTRPEHFEVCDGCAVIVRLIRPQEGQKEFAGLLCPPTDEEIVIETEDGSKQAFDRKGVASVRLMADWDEL